MHTLINIKCMNECDCYGMKYLLIVKSDVYQMYMVICEMTRINKI